MVEIFDMIFMGCIFILIGFGMGYDYAVNKFKENGEDDKGTKPTDRINQELAS